MYSLKEAAEKAGKGKPAILKAIQKGRISAKKNELNEWEIDPAELHRVYPMIPVNSSGSSLSERQEILKNTHETIALEREVELLRERIADKDNVIDDLRRRLDVESEERRKLTMLLTHKKEPENQSEPKKSKLLEKLFGRHD